MTVVDRSSGKEITFKNRKSVITTLYSPVSEYWSLYSPIVGAILEKYKDVPLTPYKPTKYILEAIKRDPSKAENVPRWEVKGYDQAVGREALENELRDEFYKLYTEDSPIVRRFVNRFNPEVKIL